MKNGVLAGQNLHSGVRLPTVANLSNVSVAWYATYKAICEKRPASDTHGSAKRDLRNETLPRLRSDSHSCDTPPSVNGMGWESKGNEAQVSTIKVIKGEEKKIRGGRADSHRRYKSC